MKVKVNVDKKTKSKKHINLLIIYSNFEWNIYLLIKILNKFLLILYFLNIFKQELIETNKSINSINFKYNPS